MNNPPPLEDQRALVIFHYIIAPDAETGEGLTVMAPPAQLAGLEPEDVDRLIDLAGQLVTARGEYLSSSLDRYLFATAFAGLRAVHLYIKWTMVDARFACERLH